MIFPSPLTLAKRAGHYGCHVGSLGRLVLYEIVGDASVGRWVVGRTTDDFDL